jgi:hypothetical protein
MEPVLVIVGGLWLWNKLKGKPASVVPGSNRAIASIVAGDDHIDHGEGMDAIIDAKIAQCGGEPVTILPAIVPRRLPPEQIALPMVPKNLPVDAVWTQTLATYSNGTTQDVWTSPTKGRFIVTTTPQGGVTVQPDAPMSLMGGMF